MATRQVRYATIYVFPSTDKNARVRVSAAPEILSVSSGDIIDWTVVDATGRAGKISIKWKEGTPLKEEPDAFGRAVRARVRRGVKKRTSYRYSILLDGVEVFDPEIEIMS